MSALDPPGGGGGEPGAERAGSALVARRSRLVGMVAGALLLGAAAWAVLRQPGTLADAAAALAGAPVWLVMLGAGLPLVSLVLSSLVFLVLTTRYGRVGGAEMFGLIGAAWLLNYLPLWPGMVGRLAYHRRMNGIEVRDSVKALIWANVLGLIAAAVHTAVVGLGGMLWTGDEWKVAALAAAPILPLLLFAAYAHARPPAPDPHVWRLVAVLAVRLVELQVWSARYWVCFALVGAPISWGGALAVAGLSQLVTAVPLTSNGLGVREWAVGLLAPLLPAALTLRPALSVHSALSADLMNRAIEVGLAIPVGLLCAWWIARRAAGRSGAADDGANRGP